jgi:capsular exopolysaccharide synthesis family protein
VKGRYVWYALRRWWWLPALAGLLAATTSYDISSRLPRVYEGLARLQVTPAQVSSRSTDYNTVLGAEGLTRTYAEMLRTRSVVQAALGATSPGQRYEGALQSITVTALRDTQLIEVRAHAQSPELASQLANALADVFVQQLRAAQATRFAATRQALGLRLDQLATSIAARSERVAALQAEQPSAEREAALAQAESELAQLQPSYSAASQSYQNVLLAEVQDQDLLETVERATPAATPVAPRVLLNVALAGVAGLLVGLAVILLIEAVDDRVSSAERLRSAAGVCSLGTLALLPRGTALALQDGTLASGGNHAQVSEVFRSLLARLSVEAQDQPPGVLLVTGCAAGAGATLVAVGLARTAAQAGQQVVLVDANLRAACPTGWANAPARVGLAAILSDARLSVPDVLRPSGVRDMWLLSGGAPPPDPGALLASRRMAERVRELRTHADLVVIDAPPALASNAAALLARHADATLLVVDTRRTHAAELKLAATLLRETGAHLVGAVLNRVPPRSVPYYDKPSPRRPRPAIPASALGARLRPWAARMLLAALASSRPRSS